MVSGGGGCRGQTLRLALAQVEVEVRAEQSLSISRMNINEGILTTHYRGKGVRTIRERACAL